MDSIQSFLPQSIDNLFDFMGIAEEEIQKGMEKYPKQREKVWGIFPNLFPPQHLKKYPVLYRSHCRRLIDRLAHNAVSTDPTPAEYCAIFSDLSAQAPLQTDVMVAYWYCFKEALPEEAAKMTGQDGDLEYLRESYPGATNEILTNIKRKIQSKSNG